MSKHGSDNPNGKNLVKNGATSANTSVGYGEGAGGANRSRHEWAAHQSETQTPGTHQYGDPDEATRMSSIDAKGEEVIIASSRLQDFDRKLLETNHGEPESATINQSAISVRAKERRRGRLIVTSLRNRYTHYLADGPTLIGRGSENQIQLHDVKVSRQHARIEQLMETYRIVDSGAGNGMRINGKRVRTAELFDGDVIRLGDTTLAYETIGWSRQRSHRALESGLLGWLQILSQLGTKDKTRLGVYAVSLAFLTGGFIFLLMSFIAQPKQLTRQQQALNYRHQAEKRALVGDLAGALRSMDKVTFINGTLSTSDQERRKKWSKRIEEAQLARLIQVSTLGDPLPEELDNLLNQLDGNLALQAEASARISKAKLRYLRSTLKHSKPVKSNRKRLLKIYHSINEDHVTPQDYKQVSEALTNP